MKLKVNWKELGKQLWDAVKPVLLAAIGGGLVTLANGCSSLTPSAKTQSMSLYAIGIPGIARPLAVTSLRSCAQSLRSLRGFPPKQSFCGAYLSRSLSRPPTTKATTRTSPGLKGSDPSVYALLYMLDFGAADVVACAAS